jgi:hypothetical protein
MQTMIRVIKDKNNPYLMLNKTSIQDIRLSAKAKGIHVYILSLPDDWKIYINELKNHFSDGRDSITSGINELIKFGYIKREKLKNEKGQFCGYEYQVFEIPQIEEPEEEKTETGKSVFGESDFGQSNTTKYLLKENNNIENNLSINPSSEPTKKQIKKDRLMEDLSNNINNKISNLNKLNDKNLTNSISQNENNTNNSNFELENIYKQCNVDLFQINPDLFLTIKEVIKQLYNAQGYYYNLIKNVRLEHIDLTTSNYKQAQQTKNIKNKVAYFKTCLVNAIIELGINNIGLSNEDFEE